MQKKESKDLDVAIELFNSELSKLKAEKKAKGAIRKAEQERASTVKELKEAESNPDLSAEEKEAAKDRWIEADQNLKKIKSGDTDQETVNQDTEEDAGKNTDPPETIDEPDVLGCGVPLDEIQESVKEDKQFSKVVAEEPNTTEENQDTEPEVADG